MEVITIKIGFIGAGKVGFALGKYLSENNINLVGYYSKNINSAIEAAKFTNSKFFTSIKGIIKECDTIIITTPDSVIEEVWNSIKKLCINEKIICHCSGSLSSSIFSEIDNYSSYGYSIHPIFAFSDKYNSHKNLKSAFITIEGAEKYLNNIKELFSSLGNTVKVISKENKYKYHCASVMVSNHIIALINNSVSLLKECNFTDIEAIEALYPLIKNNIENVYTKGVKEALTGPIERGDVTTIKGHLDVLDGDVKAIYTLLSRSLLNIAKEKNAYRSYEKIELMIGE